MIEPEDLVPKLPSPRDLQPFPTTISIIYEGHTDMVRSITVDPRGQFLISGSDDFTIKGREVLSLAFLTSNSTLFLKTRTIFLRQITMVTFISVWEIATGRCMRTMKVGGVVRSVSWCPNQALSLVAVAADRKLLLINPGVGDNLVVAKTDALLKEIPEDSSVGEFIAIVL